MGNTGSVINWFKKIPNKNLYKFLMFDIKDFYPSVKEKLLWQAMAFSARQISVTNKDTEAIFNAWKSLLYYNNEPWVEKAKINFDVTMSAYDVAEICELNGSLYFVSLSILPSSKNIVLEASNVLRKMPKKQGIQN